MSRFSRLYDRMTGHLVRRLGDDVTYIPASGAPYEIQLSDGKSGIFDPFSEDVDPDTGAIIQSSQPTLYLRRVDMQADPQRGDRVTVNGKTYSIIEPNPDGQGGYNMRLHG